MGKVKGRVSNKLNEIRISPRILINITHMEVTNVVRSHKIITKQKPK